MRKRTRTRNLSVFCTHLTNNQFGVYHLYASRADANNMVPFYGPQLVSSFVNMDPKVPAKVLRDLVLKGLFTVVSQDNEVYEILVRPYADWAKSFKCKHCNPKPKPSKFPGGRLGWTNSLEEVHV
jgi:hypothetical protein